MSEFISACVLLVNLPYTLLLIITILYWLSVIVGLFDLDIFGNGHDSSHLSIDNANGNISDCGNTGSVEASTDVVSLDAMSKLLSLGGVPITIFISFFSIISWSMSMIINYYLRNSSILVALAISLPIILSSLLLARILVIPFVYIFKALSKNHDEQNKIIGNICKITTSKANESFGQATIETKGAPIVINVRTINGVCLKEGDTALVVRYDPEKHIYIIKPCSDIPEIENLNGYK